MNKYVKGTLLFGGSLALLNCGSDGTSGNANKGDNVASDNLGMPLEEVPNIVYIVIDDMGYGDLGAYGSSINTPNLDELAKNGIQYLNYFTSPLSSPSRASLLTGSEANKVGMGTVTDVDLGEIVPNLNARIHPEYAPITHTLREAGYTTIATGKWHLGPFDEFRPDGDKYHWPSGKGFDKNYSFVSGQANQFEPGGMIEGDEYVVADTSSDDYHLTRDIFDRTLGYIDEVDKDDPFFAYIGLGAMHGPFNVAKSYIDKYKGKFNDGWDKEREKILARQIELGIMPEGTQLPPRDKAAPAWDSLSVKEKAVAERHMETYAGFLEHTDEEIGKFLDELKKRDEYDNTIFIFVSDNGANYAGGPIGSIMSHANRNLFTHDIDTQYDLMDKFGNALYGTQYNNGWAMASNTPLRYFKTKTFYGGVKTAFIASWKDGIKNPGRLAHEMVAVFDIAPTMLDIIGAKPLGTVNGVEQEIMQGVSFREIFESDKPMENPNNKKLAIMMYLDRMYADGSGYMIVTNPYTQEWELYDIENDITQINNLAKAMPEQLEKMVNEYNTTERKEFNNSENLLMDIIQKVDKEIIIERYGQVAIDVFNSIRNGVPPTKEAAEYVKILKYFSYVTETGKKNVGTMWYKSPESKLSKKNYTYSKDQGYFFPLSVPNTGPVSHKITTTIDIPENPEGVIFANGGIDGGYVLYINKDKKLVYEYNYLGEKQKVISDIDVDEGKYDIEVDYTKTTESSGSVNLKIDGEIIASRSQLKTLPMIISFDYFSIGSDVGSKVSDDYITDFEFNGNVDIVNISLGNDLLK